MQFTRRLVNNVAHHIAGAAPIFSTHYVFTSIPDCITQSDAFSMIDIYIYIYISDKSNTA